MIFLLRPLSFLVSQISHGLIRHCGGFRVIGAISLDRLVSRRTGVLEPFLAPVLCLRRRSDTEVCNGLFFVHYAEDSKFSTRTTLRSVAGARCSINFESTVRLFQPDFCHVFAMFFSASFVS